MKDNVKRVFYVRQVAHPCYLDIIATRPEIRLDKLENDSPDEVADADHQAAHAYQIGSARDELNDQVPRPRDLLARMPNLLIVSTNGAGFDTVNVKDCTDAGVLVVNQTGGNAEAVATHVIAMVLRAVEADRPDQPRDARRPAARPRWPSWATTSPGAPSASSGSAMSGGASRRSRAACSTCR